MGRELQKKKRRSGLPKIKQRPKSIKTVVKDPIIAAHWDQNQTVTQNYQRLGLTRSLTAPRGGTQDPSFNAVSNLDAMTPAERTNHQRLLNASNKSPAEVRVEEVKVMRDPESGTLVRVSGGEQNGDAKDDADGRASKAESRRKTMADKGFKPLDDPLNDFDERKQVLGIKQQHAASGYIPAATGNTVQTPALRKNTPAQSDVPQLLAAEAEKLRRRPKKKVKLTDREAEWISRLVQKHGGDFKAMFWDRKRNVMQLSEGELRKRVDRWLGEKRISEGHLDDLKGVEVKA
ncbi:MAG: Nucleolar protein 16 [Alyxoria varia]|nr:MAG: Nucleolar protein 16 [Alyxoria varia]